MTVNVTPVIGRIALWLQEQAEQYEYADIGVLASLHDGELRKVRYETTVKMQAGLESLTRNER